jgi:hypothetical protein
MLPSEDKGGLLHREILQVSLEIKMLLLREGNLRSTTPAILAQKALTTEL